ncbi:MAG: TetR family transcriptional regulator [Bdellovibrionales bacterium]
MARKTKEDAEKTRASILRAAEICFYEEGVVRTSLQKIAEAAGVTRGAVYWHFKDKVDLLRAIADETFLPHQRFLDVLAESELENPLKDLKKQSQDILHSIAHNLSHRRIFTIITKRCEYVAEMESLMKRNQECRAQVIERLTKILQKAKRKKQLSTAWAPHTAALALQSLFVGILTIETAWSCPDPIRDRNHTQLLNSFFEMLEG